MSGEKLRACASVGLLWSGRWRSRGGSLARRLIARGLKEGTGRLGGAQNLTPVEDVKGEGQILVDQLDLVVLEANLVLESVVEFGALAVFVGDVELKWEYIFLE